MDIIPLAPQKKKNILKENFPLAKNHFQKKDKEEHILTPTWLNRLHVSSQLWHRQILLPNRKLILLTATSIFQKNTSNIQLVVDTTQSARSLSSKTQLPCSLTNFFTSLIQHEVLFYERHFQLTKPQSASLSKTTFTSSLPVMCIDHSCLKSRASLINSKLFVIRFNNFRSHLHYKAQQLFSEISCFKTINALSCSVVCITYGHLSAATASASWMTIKTHATESFVRFKEKWLAHLYSNSQCRTPSLEHKWWFLHTIRTRTLPNLSQMASSTEATSPGNIPFSLLSMIETLAFQKLLSSVLIHQTSLMKFPLSTRSNSSSDQSLSSRPTSISCTISASARISSPYQLWLEQEFLLRQ